MAYALEDEFGDIIGKARRGQNMSQGEVAQASEITESDLSRMEKYTLKPTESQVYKLAEVLNLDGKKLLAIATEQWEPSPQELLPENAPLDVVTISAPVGGWPVNAYLLVCNATGEAAIIDTAAHPEVILEILDIHKVNPTTILLTHSHGDHTNGLPELQCATDCQTYIHKNEPKPETYTELKELEHSDVISIGQLMVTVADTPGHTSGGCSFVTQSAAFVGDAIFAGSVGGPNISYEDEINSVRDNILSLPDDVRLFPGHGPPTTVGEEKLHNPFF
ncbi:hydrolase [Candidatus Poribacteria bacterium]|nr:MAG: hydrolase [Candidatus Poribacteria bacterium]